jgi:hypothetical protein
MVAHGCAEVSDLTETCALDVADRGPHTLNEIGELLNLSRERVKQVVEETLTKIRKTGLAEKPELTDRGEPAYHAACEFPSERSYY